MARVVVVTLPFRRMIVMVVVIGKIASVSIEVKCEDREVNSVKC